MSGETGVFDMAMVIAIAGIVLTIWFGAPPYLRKGNTLPWLIDRLERHGKIAANYHKLIEKLAGRLDTYFGPSHKPKAFFRSLSLAFYYPVFFLFGGWMFGGHHELYGWHLLPDYDVFWHKLLLFLGVVGIAILLQITFRKNAGYAAIFGGGFAVVFAFVIAIAVAGVGAGAAAGSVAVAVAFTVFGAFSGAVAVIFAFAVAITGNNEATFLIIFLFVVLPLFNCLFDFISWHWSRIYIERAKHNTHWRSFCKDIVKDGFIALCLLVCLGVTLPYIVHLSNAMIPVIASPDGLPPPGDDVFIRWKLYADAARTDPFGTGLIVNGMIITTFIPTALHIAIACLAICVNIPNAKLATYLKTAIDEDNNIKLSWGALRLIPYFISPLIAFSAIIYGIYVFPFLGLANWLYALVTWSQNQPAWLVLGAVGLIMTCLISPIYRRHQI